MRGLSHKRALVTGGTSGLGAAIARRLVEEGARVVICGRDSERGHELAAEIGASFVQADVRSETDNERSVAEAIERLGGLDIAILNAGTIEEAPLSETTDEAWDAILETNLIAPFQQAQLVLPALREAGGGTVIITASDAGVWGEREIGAYSVSKRAAIMLAQMLAVEAGRAGIRVNALCPGDIAPGMRTSISGRPDAPTDGWYRPPVGRLGEAADIAGAAAFLCSDDATFISGTAMLVDGGMRSAVNAWRTYL